MRQLNISFNTVYRASILNDDLILKFRVHYFRHFHSMFTNHVLSSDRTIALCPLWMGRVYGPCLRAIIDRPNIYNVIINAYQNGVIWYDISSNDSWSNNVFLVAIANESKELTLNVILAMDYRFANEMIINLAIIVALIRLEFEGWMGCLLLNFSKLLKKNVHDWKNPKK